MACNARVANAGAQLGLPELQLGAPSIGQQTIASLTARAARHYPRLRRHRPPSPSGWRGEGVDDDAALQERQGAVTRSPIGCVSAHAPCLQADEALKSGLLDAVVPSAEEVLPAAKALALEIAAGKRPKVQSLKKGDKLPNMMARARRRSRARRASVGRSARHAHRCSTSC